MTRRLWEIKNKHSVKWVLCQSSICSMLNKPFFLMGMQRPDWEDVRYTPTTSPANHERTLYAQHVI